jgi:hypothetical protein
MSLKNNFIFPYKLIFYSQTFNKFLFLFMIKIHSFPFENNHFKFNYHFEIFFIHSFSSLVSFLCNYPLPTALAAIALLPT